MTFKKSIQKTAVMSSIALAVSLAVSGNLAAAELEEMIVTATKRAVSVQEVPMSIEAVSGERLEANGVSDFGEFATSIPNFSVGDGVTNNLITMRGMGSGEDRSFEQSVSMFQNGVYMPRSRQTRSPFFDVDRIEVLRGPQAVLFGLNSTAGAVSVHSALTKPGDDLTADVDVEYEAEYSGARLTGVFGNSLSDTFGVRFAVQTGDSGDGYVENKTIDGVGLEGIDGGATETSLMRLSAVFQPMDAASLTFIYDYADHTLTGTIGEIINGIATDLEGGVDGVADWSNSSVGELLPTLAEIGSVRLTQEGAEQNVGNASLNFEYEMQNGGSLSALVARTDYDYSLAVDLGGTEGADLGLPTVVLDAMSFEDYQQTSAEVRYNSPVGNQFEWIAGLYTSSADLTSDQPNIIDASIFSGIDPVTGEFNSILIERGTNLLTQDSSTLSGYALGTWNFSDAFRVQGGFRYSDVEKDWARSSLCQFSSDGTSFINFNAGLGVCALASDQSGQFKSSNLMPEFIAQYDFSDDRNFYAKYSESAKSGGVATGTSIPDGSLIYDDESASSIELGLKNRFAGGAAELNLTYFNTDFDDLQVKSSTVSGTTVVTKIGNAGKATSSGFEIDGRFAVTNAITLGGSLAFLDASFDEYLGASCNTSGSTPFIDPANTDLGCDAAGQSLPFAADMTANFYADFSQGMANGLYLVGGINLSYSDEYFTDGTFEPTLVQDSYSKIGAHVGVEGENWGVSLIGKNLNNQEIYVKSTTRSL